MSTPASGPDTDVPVADETDFLVGRRRDRLRRVGTSWQVVRRELLLDQSVLLAKNLSIFV